MQLFAQDSILIEDNCQLNYPSVVALLGKGNTLVSRKIVVKKDVKIKGSLFLYNENFDRKHQALVSKYLRSSSGGFFATKSQNIWCAEKHLRIEYMLHTTT